MWDPYANYEKVRLSNGLKVYVNHLPNRPWVKMGCIVHAGSFHDPAEYDGVAHFVEHLMSANAPASKDEIQDFFLRLGGTINLGSTGIFGTSYKFTVPVDVSQLRKGLSYFSGMLLNNEIVRRVDEEREIIIQEWFDEFGVKCFYEKFLQQNKIVYEGYPLERCTTPLGSLDSIKEVQKDVLLSFYAKYYVPSNMSLVFVSGLPCDQIIDIVSESEFAQEHGYFRTTMPEPVNSVQPLSENFLTLRMSEHGFSGVDRCFYRSVAKVPNISSVSIFSILGDVLYDMFFKEMRDKKNLTYSFNPAYENLSYFTRLSFTGWIKSGTEKEVSRIVSKVISEIPLQKKIFEKTREGCINGRKLIDVDGGELLQGAMDDLTSERHIFSIKEEIARYEEITFDDIVKTSSFLAPEYRHEYIQVP